MPSLQDIKKRIDSVKNTQKITKAMKMVSAAKLRRAQEACEASRPFGQSIDVMLSRLFGLIDNPNSEFLAKKSNAEDKILIILITSNRGLCGAFNSALIRTAERFMREQKDGSVDLAVIGTKGRDYFKRRKANIVYDFTEFYNKPNLPGANFVGNTLKNDFLDGKYKEIHLIYTKFKSAITQEVIQDTLLPIKVDDSIESKGEAIFEENQQSVLKSLMPRKINAAILRAMLESTASEHGARMTAMDSATTNSRDMINNLTLIYNRARQASITKELIEIISGAEALV